MRRKYLYSLCTFLLVTTNLDHVSSFSMGAPDSACQAITPGHSHSPQSGESPADLVISKNWVVPGQLLELELKTKDNSTFKGFIIQARNLKLKDQQVGSFVLSGEEASYMTCGRGIHNSITHRKSNSKSSILAKWMAPSDFEGDVIFRYTFLKEYKTFWVGMETKKIRVSREAANEEDESSTDSINEVDVDELVPSLKSNDGTIKVVDKEDGSSTFVDNTGEIDKHHAEHYDKEENIISDDIPQPAQNALTPKDSLEKTDKRQEEEYQTPIYRSSTTTLPTTTASTEPSVQLPATSGSMTDPNDPIFAGCNHNTTCFGYPDGCVKQRRCQIVLAYRSDYLDFIFEMKGRSSGYIAMALSRDALMGDDLTTQCVITSNGGVDIMTGYNRDYSGNRVVPRGSSKQPKDGIVRDWNGMKVSRKDGWISCRWKRRGEVTIENSKWNLGEDLYHVMLARGQVDDGVIRRHDQKTVSAELKGLGDVAPLESKSRLFIFLHGAFMLGAWICSASLGIIMARYFKQTWTSKRCFNLDQWFIWHRNFMMLTWCLTMAGFILILLELRDLTKTINTNPHAIFGFVTVGLCFIQPFLALIRCSPNHHLRPIYNWVHWFIGNVAQILAIVAIFYAVDLPKAQLPRPETDWLLVAFVAFHFLTHLILSCINCNSDSSKIGYNSYPPTMRHMARGHMFPDYEELTRDSPGSTVRLFVLVVYFIVNVIVSAALILLVVLAPTRTKLEEIGILPTLN